MRIYGWKRDLPDKRDRYLAPRLGPVPERIDLRQTLAMPPIWHQGALGSCTAFAIGRVMAYEYRLLGIDYEPACLHLYYEEREDEGTVPIDAGAFIRTGCKVAAREGVASEEMWPYSPLRFTQKPPKSVRKDALKYRVSSYERVPQIRSQICSTLAEKNAIVFGASIYESFESAAVEADGRVPLPAAGEDMLGGHALVIAGYDELRKTFLIANSWGTYWGLDGYGTMPYDYILDPDLCADFWVLKTVTP